MVTCRTGFGRSRTKSGRFGRGADNRSVLTEGDGLICAVMVARKDAAPITQSIEGIVVGEPVVS